MHFNPLKNEINCAMFAAYILSTILATVCASHLPFGKHIAGRADLSLTNFLLEHQSRSASPETLSCFETYVPIMQQASTQWAKDYKLCWEVAESNHTDLLGRASADQSDVSATADSVCSYIKTCAAISDNLSALDCYSLLTENAASIIYTVSNNASDMAADIRQQMNTNTANTYKCCNESERTYVETTALVLNALEYCLQNGPPPTVAPPTGPPSTTTPPTTASPNISTTTPSPQLIDAAAARILTKESNVEQINPAPGRNKPSAFSNWAQ